MTTPTGQISLSDVALEIYGNATRQISMTENNVYTLAGKTPGTAISMSDLKGKSWIVTFFGDISGSNPNSPVTGSTFSQMNVTGTLSFSKGTGITATVSKNGGTATAIPTSLSVAPGDSITINASATMPFGQTVNSDITISGAYSQVIGVSLTRS
jgi:hypothetical protein